MDSNERIAITGIGLTTALGHGVDANWEALCAGRDGMRAVSSIDTEGFAVQHGGEAPKRDAAGTQPRQRVRTMLFEVCVEALQRAGIGAAFSNPERVGLAAGSSLAASASRPEFWKTYLEHGPARAEYAELASYDTPHLLDELCERFNIAGPATLVSNACAAGGSSLVVAGDWLRVGRADVVLATGFDILDQHTFAGFGALGALAPEPMRPFSVDRAGMRLGDGFGALVLERADHAQVHGRTPLAYLAGYGESADAHNLTQPDPEGRGAALAMSRALAAAGLESQAIGYINVHGTATPANDGGELLAMHAVFGSALESTEVNATKPAVGHTLGGAGAVEAVFTTLVLANQFAPPTLGLGQSRLEPEAERMRLAPAGHALEVHHAMSNSFGFGGCNTSLVFSRA